MYIDFLFYIYTLIKKIKDMLSIGFANKFYTLWDVSSDEITTGDATYGYSSYTKVYYTYIQNLSMDEENAKKKASEKGCKNLEVDRELFGRNNSFYKEIKTSSYIGDRLDWICKWNPYLGVDINEITDVDFLYRYYQKYDNVFAKKFLLQNGYVFFKDWDDIITQEQYDNILAYKANQEIIKSIFSNLDTVNVFEVECNQNTYGNGVMNDVKINDIKTSLLFPEVKGMYYNGIEYYLPSIKGVGKKS